MDQVFLLLEQAANSNAYIRRFNILVPSMSDKKKIEMMLKQNAELFRENEQGKSLGNKDSRKQHTFQKVSLFRSKGNRGRGIFSRAG